MPSDREPGPGEQKLIRMPGVADLRLGDPPAPKIVEWGNHLCAGGHRKMTAPGKAPMPMMMVSRMSRPPVWISVAGSQAAPRPLLSAITGTADRIAAQSAKSSAHCAVMNDRRLMPSDTSVQPAGGEPSCISAMNASRYTTMPGADVTITLSTVLQRASHG